MSITVETSRRAYAMISNMMVGRGNRTVLSARRLQTYEFFCQHWADDEYAPGPSQKELERFYGGVSRSYGPRVNLLVRMNLLMVMGKKMGDSGTEVAYYHPVWPIPATPAELEAALNTARCEMKRESELRRQAALDKEAASGKISWSDSLLRMCDEIEKHILPYIKASYTPSRTQMELLRRLNLAIQRGRSRTPLDPKKPRSRQ